MAAMVVFQLAFWLAVICVPGAPMDSLGTFAITVIAILVQVLLVFFAAVSAIAMLFWGGAEFKPLWRRLIDKFLPAATLIGAYILLQAL
ncbi:MAG: hypothetical protein QNI87_02275 [Erythrobacter sp.]|uniref:hypothetical protein n=1 Tax=Erythrobacter sp. TaxID=1042 RepID=UPI002610BF86|nr:hypothetical protein [Erythrobacter sp.]MDJ0977340.1 hypothetical protein [Erythrobacter sp.]